MNCGVPAPSGELTDSASYVIEHNLSHNVNEAPRSIYMSLLRALQKSTERTASLLQRSATATQIRLQSNSTAPAASDAKGSEVAKVPPKEVITADVVSGAPGKHIPLKIATYFLVIFANHK